MTFSSSKEPSFLTSDPNRVLSTGGVGGSFPQTSQLPPPQKKVLLKNKITAISNKDLFDDDFKESVKVTNVQKCDFSQS